MRVAITRAKICELFLRIVVIKINYGYDFAESEKICNNLSLNIFFMNNYIHSPNFMVWK